MPVTKDKVQIFIWKSVAPVDFQRPQCLSGGVFWQMTFTGASLLLVSLSRSPSCGRKCMFFCTEFVKAAVGQIHVCWKRVCVSILLDWKLPVLVLLNSSLNKGWRMNLDPPWNKSESTYFVAPEFWVEVSWGDPCTALVPKPESSPYLQPKVCISYHILPLTSISCSQKAWHFQFWI